MKTVTILGATGSIGTSTLDLLERAPDAFRVRALTANCDVAKLAAAAIRTRAERAVVADETCLPALREALAGTDDHQPPCMAQAPDAEEQRHSLPARRAIVPEHHARARRQPAQRRPQRVAHSLIGHQPDAGVARAHAAWL